MSSSSARKPVLQLLAPSEDVPAIPRKHLLLLGVLLLLALLRGGFWVLGIETWSRIDEAQHYAYVQSLATGEGIPVVGKDRVSEDVLLVARTSRTTGYRTFALPLDADDPRWGAFREQYEAVQPPLYYALLAPVYLLSRPFGLTHSVFALRLASLGIALLTLPLLYVGARHLFPRWPSLWFGAPLMLVAIPGFISIPAAITNDALVLSAGAGVMTAAAVCWRRRMDLPSAAVLGVALGVASLAKSSTIGLVPFALLVPLVLILSRRQGVRNVVAGVLVTGGIAASLVAPWLLFNLLTYDSLSGSEAVEKITGGVQQVGPGGLAGVIRHARAAWPSFWEWQRGADPTFPLGPLFDVCLWASVGSAVFLIARRRWRDVVPLVWLGSALLTVFGAMVIIVAVLFDDRGSLVGRHLYAALPALVLFIVASAWASLGSRRASSLLAVVLALAAVRDVGVIRGSMEGWYGKYVLDDRLVPVVDQDHADDTFRTDQVIVRTPCPMRAIGLWVEGEAPSTLRLRGSQGQARARLDLEEFHHRIYRLSRPLTGTVRVELPAETPLWRSTTVEEPAVDSGHAGWPMIRVFCLVDRPMAARFSAVYDMAHPPGLTYDRAIWWGRGWAGVSVLAALLYLLRVRSQRDVVAP